MQKEERVVVIASDKMGAGDDALGALLLKSFIFALSQSEQLPDKVLFYNSGVFLTARESESLKDLQLLEKEGVIIASCGTCLDFFGLKEEIKVGQVTNMQAIVEAQMRAGTLIRP